MTLVQPCTPASHSPAGSPTGTPQVPARGSFGANFREQLRSLTAAVPAAGALFRTRAKGGNEGCNAGLCELVDRPNFRSAQPEAGRSNPGQVVVRDAEPKHGGPDGEADNHNLPPELNNDIWAEPLVRVLSALSPSQGSALVQCSDPPTAVLDRIALQLIRKVGLGPSAVHLEFGEGLLAEGKLTVHATDDGLEITLQAPHGVDTSQLCQALSQRLERKGLRVSRLEVT